MLKQHCELDPILARAHYDGPLYPIGADNNASVVATLLALAERLASDPPRRPAWLVAFDKEEGECSVARPWPKNFEKDGSRITELSTRSDEDHIRRARVSSP
jgi:hypothetical protein